MAQQTTTINNYTVRDKTKQEYQDKEKMKTNSHQEEVGVTIMFKIVEGLLNWLILKIIESICHQCLLHQQNRIGNEKETIIIQSMQEYLQVPQSHQRKRVISVMGVRDLKQLLPPSPHQQEVMDNSFNNKKEVAGETTLTQTKIRTNNTQIGQLSKTYKILPVNLKILKR